jgi:hypothetical protein
VCKIKVEAIALAGPAISFYEHCSIAEQQRDNDTGGEAFGPSLEGVVDMADAMAAPCALPRAKSRLCSRLRNNNSAMQNKQVSAPRALPACLLLPSCLSACKLACMLACFILHDCMLLCACMLA